MSDTCKTVRIMPSHPSQGDFVEINEADFDKNLHKLFKGEKEPAPAAPAPAPAPALALAPEIDAPVAE